MPVLSPVQIAAVLLAQLSGAAGLVAVSLLLTGGTGLVAPLGSLFLTGGVAMLWLGSRTPGWPDRPTVFRLAWSSAGLHWLVGAAGYCAIYFADPGGYTFGIAGLLIVAPVIGLLPGLAALVLTLCAGDGVRSALGIAADDLSQQARRPSEPAAPGEHR